MSSKEGFPTGIKGIAFTIEHKISSEIVNGVREIVLENNERKQALIDEGFVTEERLGEITKDEKIQKEYFWIMKRIHHHGLNSLEVRERVGIFPPNSLVGWFDYHREYYEKRWDLELISPKK